MSGDSVTLEQLQQLTEWDTPTICNALEVVMPERRGFGYTTEHLFCARPSQKPIIGIAKTATIRAMNPGALPPAMAKDMRAAYYEYVADSPLPTISIIQDIDPIPGYGAFWGEVNTAIHKGLGCDGLVTNGSIRDLDDCAPGFQMLAGKVGPSHAFVHLVEFANQVNIYGMSVKDGDFVHADQHGAVVVPAEAVAKIPEGVDLMVRRESVILDAARSDDFNIEKLKAAMADSAEIH